MRRESRYPPGASTFQYDSCAGSTLSPILKFDSSGNLMKSFGAGMFIFPHKISMDRDGNLWVADQRSANERELAKFPEERKRGTSSSSSVPMARSC